MGTRLLMAACFLVGLGGCSKLHSTPINAGDEATVKDGFVYYPPAYYVTVKPATNKDGTPIPNGGYDITTFEMPDFEHPRVLKISSGYGANEHSFKLDNGWMLTAVDSKTDTQVPQTISAITGIVTAGMAIKSESLKPGLFRAKYDVKLHKLVLEPVNLELASDPKP